jgi:hypothetical protein
MEIIVYYNGFWNKIIIGTLIQEENWNISPKGLESTSNYQWPFPSFLDYLPGIIYDCLSDWWWQLVIDRFMKSGFHTKRYESHIFWKLLLLDDNSIWGFILSLFNDKRFLY